MFRIQQVSAGSAPFSPSQRQAAVRRKELSPPSSHTLGCWGSGGRPGSGFKDGQKKFFSHKKLPEQQLPVVLWKELWSCCVV